VPHAGGSPPLTDRRPAAGGEWAEAGKARHPSRSVPPAWFHLAPATFVILWSTGFIGAKYGLPWAEPFTFLFLRFLIVVAILIPVVALVRAPFPRDVRQCGHVAVVGVLVHGVYLGGVFAAISMGIDAGVSALIVGLQPLVTACIVGPLLGERVSARQWVGLALGFAGVALVVSQEVRWQEQHLPGVIACIGALVGITVGTVYQKRYCGDIDLRTGSLIQFSAAGVFVLLIAVASESMSVRWHPEFLLALAWLVVVLSLGAITLLMMMVRHGAASRVASLFYLVPPVTATMAWLLFGESLGPAAMAGMMIAVSGVWMVLRHRAPG
jgi:drug/metabolite transporter (DMT)-like permease